MGCKSGESDGCKKVYGEPVVSGGDTLPVFELSEHALDDISMPVGRAVEKIGGISGRAPRYDGFDPPVGEPVLQSIGIIGLVCEEAFCGRNGLQQGMAMPMSAMLPGVSATVTIPPQASARQWILVVRPPLDMPTARVHSPYSLTRTFGSSGC